MGNIGSHLDITSVPRAQQAKSKAKASAGFTMPATSPNRPRREVYRIDQRGPGVALTRDFGDFFDSGLFKEEVERHGRPGHRTA